MPGIAHEAPVELLRHNPLLAAALLHGSGVAIPVGGSAVMAAGDLTSALPAELRADAVVVLGGKLAVVVEVQRSPDEGKRRVWPACLTLARAQHDCPAVLTVICPGRATGRWARRPIPTGHPGFDLVPLVIDADTTPRASVPGLAGASPELAVLAAFTGAVDLEQDAGRRQVLGTLAAARLDEERLEIYTHLIRAVASAASRSALEALMTTAFKDEFIDRIKAEGRAEVLNDEFIDRIKAEGRAEVLKEEFIDRIKAEGRAEGEAAGRAKGEVRGRADMLLRVLAARGLEVPDRVRERVLACTDLSQLDAWGDSAVAATSLDDVFAG
jgi:hypothetical protein